MLLEYRQFRAQVNFSASTKSYYGEVLVGENLIAFQAAKRHEIAAAMHQAVDQFLAPTEVLELS